MEVHEYIPNIPYHTPTTPPGGRGSATPPPHHRGGGGRSHMGPVYGTHPMGGVAGPGAYIYIYIYIERESYFYTSGVPMYFTTSPDNARCHPWDGCRLLASLASWSSTCLASGNPFGFSP